MTSFIPSRNGLKLDSKFGSTKSSESQLIIYIPRDTLYPYRLVIRSPSFFLWNDLIILGYFFISSSHKRPLLSVDPSSTNIISTSPLLLLSICIMNDITHCSKYFSTLYTGIIILISI